MKIEETVHDLVIKANYINLEVLKEIYCFHSGIFSLVCFKRFYPEFERLRWDKDLQILRGSFIIPVD